MRIILVAFLWLNAFAALGQSYVFVFLNKKENKQELPQAEVDKLMEGHMANIKRLASEGKLIAAGPFEGGGGIFIFKSSSRQEVQSWLSTDPGVQAKRWDIEMFGYTPLRGSVCAVGEPIQMTNYIFIRYTVNLSKTTIGNASAMAKEHERYLDQADASQLITRGTFGPDEGGIVVLKESAPTDWTAKDPAVLNGLITTDIKKLYIARGAFCEK